MPVFGTMAARFNDDGVTALYQALKPRLGALGLPLEDGTLPLVNVRHSTNQTPVVPAARTRYLAEITDTVRGYKKRGHEPKSCWPSGLKCRKPMPVTNMS